jgi:acyl carrier protein
MQTFLTQEKCLKCGILRADGNNKVPIAGDALESGEVCLAMELEKLREVIAGILSVDPKEITEDTTFLEDLGADSLDVYQIIMGIEDAFQIEIPAEKAERITTVGEAVELIKSSRE